jgi:hypothetical protein
MTTFAKTWNTATQRGPVDQSTDTLQANSALWDFFGSMLGLVGGATGAGVMTVDSSCDGTTAGAAGDGVNRLGTTFAAFASKCVHAAAGVAHSWFVLKSTPLNLYILVSMQNAGQPGTNELYFSFGTPFSGGTTTARPTSAKEFQSVVSFRWDPSSALTGCKFMSNIASDGSFFWLRSNDSSGGFQSVIRVTKLARAHTDDTVPIQIFTAGSASSTVVFSNYINSGNLSLMRDGTNSSTVISGLTSISFNQTSDLYATGNLSGADAETDGGANLFDDDLIGVYVDSVGHKSKRGYLEDYWHAPQSLVDGQCEPQTGGPPYKRMVVGRVWYPVNGLAALPNL